MTGPDDADTAALLRQAWDAMIERIGRARDAVDDPALHPPPPDDRTLAEGYRYLLGFVFSAIERAFVSDPDFPCFRRAIQLADKSTIDNADAMYLETPIDGSRTYRIRGRAGDMRHWRGEPPAATGRKAPQYVIFEAHTGYAGDSGGLAELRPGGGRAGTGTLDIADLAVEPDGSFEILAGPDRPGITPATSSRPSARRGGRGRPTPPTISRCACSSVTGNGRIRSSCTSRRWARRASIRRRWTPSPRRQG